MSNPDPGHDRAEFECPGCGCELSERLSVYHENPDDNLLSFWCGSEQYRGHFNQSSRCRIQQLEKAIVHVVTQKADDLCWMDLKNLAALVDVEFDGHVGDKDAMLKNCSRYIDRVCLAGGSWPTYEELVSMLFRAGVHAPDCKSASLGVGDDPDEEMCTCGWAEIRDKLWPDGVK